MTRRALLSSACLIAFMPIGRAQNDGDEQNVYLRLIDWFRRLVVAVNGLADILERQRFVSFAQSLLLGLEQMLTDKLEIISMLQSEGRNQPRLQEITVRLRGSIDQAVANLPRMTVGLALFSSEGQEIASQLREVFLSRKNWVVVLETGQFDPSVLIEQARASATALATANQQVGDLIRSVNRSLASN